QCCQIHSSLDVVLRLTRDVHDSSKKSLAPILFSVHDINVVRKEKIINIGKPPQARDLSPGMFLAISHKTTCIIDLESIYLSMKHSTRQHLRCRFCNYDTFREVL